MPAHSCLNRVYLLGNEYCCCYKLIKIFYCDNYKSILTSYQYELQKHGTFECKISQNKGSTFNTEINASNIWKPHTRGFRFCTTTVSY